MSKGNGQFQTNLRTGTFPTTDADQAAQAGKRQNGLYKLATQPLRVDSYNTAVSTGVQKAHSKRVLVILIVLAIVAWHEGLLRK